MEYNIEIKFPNAESFGEKYRAYGKLAQGDWKDLFKYVMRPESFLRAVAVTEALGMPAVSGIANDCTVFLKENRTPMTDTMKQFVGAAVCALMEENGFEKTGTKRSISCDGWSKGEVYRPTIKRFKYPR